MSTLPLPPVRSAMKRAQMRPISTWSWLMSTAFSEVTTLSNEMTRTPASTASLMTELMPVGEAASVTMASTPPRMSWLNWAICADTSLPELDAEKSLISFFMSGRAA
jgi:hypothetical protein